MNRTALVAAAIGLVTLAGASIAGHGDNARAQGGMDLHAVMMSGMESMHSMKMTGDVDRDYAAMMIKHHEQAKAMNKVVIEQGKNAELKAMAEKMTAQQAREIEELKRYAK